MPSTSPAAALERPADPACEHAIFELSGPLTVTMEGKLVQVDGVGMRALNQADLTILDDHHGKPIALTQHLIAALCDLTVSEVRQLALADFTLLATDALFQLEDLTEEMGLPPRFFLSRAPVVEASI